MEEYNDYYEENSDEEYFREVSQNALAYPLKKNNVEIIYLKFI